MREEMIKLEKVKKSCRISKTLCKIFAVIVSAASMICVVAAIIIGIVGTSKVNSEFSNLIANGTGTFTVDDVRINGMIDFSIKLEEMVEQGMYAEATLMILVFATVVTAVTATVFWMLVSMFKAVGESDTPFTPVVLKKLKAVFILIVVIAALVSGLGYAVVAGCIGWSLYSIFDYGFAIQQEIDETL